MKLHNPKSPATRKLIDGLMPVHELIEHLQSFKATAAVCAQDFVVVEDGRAYSVDDEVARDEHGNIIGIRSAGD